ncbi:MAG: CotH kinase family protein [Anaerovoracaceae bacterium]
MKNKLAYISIIAVVLIVAFLANGTAVEKERKRVHQHLAEEWQPAVAAENDGKYSSAEKTSAGAAGIDADSFETNLPIVKIETGGGAIPGAPTYTFDSNGRVDINSYADSPNAVLQCGIEIIDGQQGLNRYTDTADISSQANVKYRGNSSRWFEKKSYSVHFIDKNNMKNPKDIAGMGAHDEWVLNGPFLDKTLMRNYLCMNVAGEIMEYAPEVRYCELFVDGEYKGLYLIMETISRSESRLNLTKSEMHSRVSSYIIHFDRESDRKRPLNTYGYYSYKMGSAIVELRYPGLVDYTAGRKKYVENDISRMEKILYSYDLTGGRRDYAKELDIEAFAEYFVINEFFGNLDAGWYSTFFYKDARGKLKPCVWDFNNSCDNYIENTSGVSGFTMQNAPWFEALVKDPRFVKAVINKYHTLRKDVLSEEYLISYIDDTEEWLGAAIDRNYEVWNYVWTPENQEWFVREMQFLIPVERNPRSYEEAVEQLKEYIRNRGAWLDKNIENLYQYCHESRNANDLIQ